MTHRTETVAFRILLPIVVFCLGIILAGCKKESSQAGKNGESSSDTKPSEKQVLRLGNGAEPEGLDPQIVTGVPEHFILAALLEGLLSEHPKTLAPEPGVAEQWQISEDGREYTFKLRSNAKWTNGDSVKASDFVYSYQRMLTPALGSKYAYMLHVLKNAKAFNEGTLKDFSKVGVKAVDDNTLVLILEEPTPYFLQLINHYSWYPVHPPTIKKFGGMTQRDSKWTQPENFVGNGSFRLKEWKLNEHVLVEKSATYWDAAKVKLEKIYFLPITSAETEEKMFRDNQLHATQTIPLTRIEHYQKKESDVLRVDPYLGTYFYRVNVNHKALKDKRVRQALAMSINRHEITRFVLKAGQIPAYHITPPNTAGYTARAKFEFNPERARELLSEAGFPDGRDFPKIDIYYNTSEAHKQVAEAIQQMWKKTLNIDVGLENQEWKVYLDNVNKVNYHVARAGWIGDYNDPNTFLDMWLTGGGNNQTGWSNARYDQLIKEAAKAGDPKARFEKFQEAEAILIDEMPVIPIYFYVSLSLVKPNVRGWYPNILDHHPYKYIHLE